MLASRPCRADRPRFAATTPVTPCETIKNANHLTEFIED
jgi:hypothetical protein